MKGVGHALTGTLWNPFAKLHIHIYHTSNFKTSRPVVTENLSGQNLGWFWHTAEEPLSPPFWSLNPLKLSGTTSYIRYRGGVLNGSWDIKPSMNWRGGVYHDWCQWMHLIIRNKNIYHIPKFQTNPSSGYWELVRTKFGQKEKEKEVEEEERRGRNRTKPESLLISFGRLN